jgi:hypothetical protein
MSRPYALLLALLLVLVNARPAAAESYVPITGSGSTWSQVAIDQWSKDVKKNGITVNYSGTGSSHARRAVHPSRRVQVPAHPRPHQRTVGGQRSPHHAPATPRSHPDTFAIATPTSSR